MAVFESKFKIGVEDINRKQKLSNRAILRMFQDVAGMHSDMVHFGINDICKTKLSWVILNWKIQVFKRPKYNEELTLRTWIRDANKITQYRDFEIYCAGKKVAIGSSKWTLINIDTKELANIPAGIKEKYGEEKASVFEKRIIEKLKEPNTKYTNVIDYNITRREIDVNEHVNNLFYIDMANEALPIKVYKKNECDNIQIMYKKQIKFDDKIKCLYAFEDNKHYVVIKSKDEKDLHAIIELY